ncbi:hypothetical protein F1B92_08570, partial [Campylobacter sp. FMV-PI01]
MQNRWGSKKFKTNYFKYLNANFFLSDKELAEYMEDVPNFTGLSKELKAYRDRYFRPATKEELNEGNHEEENDDEEEENPLKKEKKKICIESFCTDDANTPIKKFYPPENENKYLNYAF